MIYYRNGTVVLHIATFFDYDVGDIREWSLGIKQFQYIIHKNDFSCLQGEYRCEKKPDLFYSGAKL